MNAPTYDELLQAANDLKGYIDDQVELISPAMKIPVKECPAYKRASVLLTAALDK